MSGATIPTRLDAADIRAAFRDWKRVGADATPLMRKIGPKLVSNTQDRFDAAQDPEDRDAVLDVVKAFYLRGR